MINARNTAGSAVHFGRRARLIGAGLALAALGLLAVEGRAQEAPASGAEAESFALVGHIVDAESGRALVGAWVGLTGTEWGSLTNDEGRFRIPDMTAGQLALRVDLLGYETLDWIGSIADADESLIIELQPQPVLLEGLEVMADRFRSRRNAVGTSSFAYESDDLVNTSARTALDFLEERVGGSVVGCAGRRGSSCLYVRGRTVEPVVYVDEAPVLGGLDYLDAFAPWEFHMVEVYANGRHIRVYSPNFMKRAAEQRILPIALPF